MDVEAIMLEAVFLGVVYGLPLASAAGAWFVRSPGGAALCAFLTPFFMLPLWFVYSGWMNVWLCDRTRSMIGYFERNQPDPVCEPILPYLVQAPLLALLCAIVAAPILVYRRKALALVSAGHQPPEPQLGSLLGSDNHLTSSDEGMEE